MFLQLQAAKKKKGGKQGSETSFPDETAGDEDGIWGESPHPGGPQSHTSAKAALSDEENGNANERCKYAVQTQDDKGRGFAVDAEELEDSSEQVGVHGRHPGRGTGFDEQGIAIAVALRDGAGDAAGFKAEQQMVFIVVVGAVIEEMHGPEPQRQGDECDGKRQSPKMIFLSDAGHNASGFRAPFLTDGVSRDSTSFV